MTTGDVRQLLLSRVRDVPDHPKPGIVFKDITPLLADPVAFDAAVQAMAGQAPSGIQAVAGVEARGFILGAPLALRLGVGFVPVRKAGKLPGDVIGQTYDLEYGQEQIEVQADAVPAGTGVLVVDDVLATGGTAAAAAELLERAGARVLGLGFLLELAFLSGRDRLAGLAVSAVLTV